MAINHNDLRKTPKMKQTTKILFTLDKVLESKGISQRKLSDMTGIRFATINEMWHNRMNYLQLDNISIICQALDCTPFELFSYIPMTKDEIDEREAKIQQLYETHQEGEKKKRASKSKEK